MIRAYFAIWRLPWSQGEFALLPPKPRRHYAFGVPAGHEKLNPLWGQRCPRKVLAIVDRVIEVCLECTAWLKTLLPGGASGYTPLRRREADATG